MFGNFWRDFYQLKPRSERTSLFKFLDAVVGVIAIAIIVYALIVDQPAAISIVSFLFLIPFFFFVSFIEALIDKRKRNALITGLSAFVTLIIAIFVMLAVNT
ncbi:hypothetical protein [Oceanobacillus manasiensis]|uniref:hypothetical protein n=1 Tax=Oceanobacillus manasiensis TaxID=586413 RepID=UPI0005A6F2BE|nr:hypothetical protein [Oceanobacillus manasiensis]